MTRYATKKQLQALNAAADRKNYNRVIVNDIINSAEEDAVFTIAPIMVHEHAAGVRVAPHYRCSVQGDVFVGQFVMLDVAPEDFNALSETPEQTICT